MVGQEQDSPGGHFSAAESFKGQLTRLNMWSKILTEDDVNEVMNSCVDSIGDLVAWADFYTGIHGFLKVQISQCGNFSIFLSFRFYVKSTFGMLEVQKVPFLPFSHKKSIDSIEKCFSCFAQCGNFKIFLPLRFYVKSNQIIIMHPKLPF